MGDNPWGADRDVVKADARRRRPITPPPNKPLKEEPAAPLRDTSGMGSTGQRSSTQREATGPASRKGDPHAAEHRSSPAIPDQGIADAQADARIVEEIIKVMEPKGMPAAGASWRKTTVQYNNKNVPLIRLELPRYAEDGTTPRTWTVYRTDSTGHRVKDPHDDQKFLRDKVSPVEVMGGLAKKINASGRMKTVKANIKDLHPIEESSNVIVGDKNVSIIVKPAVEGSGVIGLLEQSLREVPKVEWKNESIEVRPPYRR
jgi:hypothetical protein